MKKTITCPCCRKTLKVTKSGKISAHKHPRVPGDRGSAPGSNVPADDHAAAAAYCDRSVKALGRILDRSDLHPNHRRQVQVEIDLFAKVRAWAENTAS